MKAQKSNISGSSSWIEEQISSIVKSSAKSAMTSPPTDSIRSLSAELTGPVEVRSDRDFVVLELTGYRQEVGGHFSEKSSLN